VVLAAIAAQRPHILVLDEPTNHLDLESVEVRCPVAATRERWSRSFTLGIASPGAMCAARYQL
jgi:predicted ABC-type transport system involved in lysophospholipase L1 biosynthesis ATPase subunit